MLTVPEAARIVRRDPETVRRWIRAGKLRSRKVGTQHVIDEADLEGFKDQRHWLPLPKEWKYTRDGRPQPDWEAILHRQRESH